MNSKKSLRWIFPVLVGVVVYLMPKKTELTHVVAITQIVEHESLDQEREGVLLALRESGFIEGKNLKVIYQNAQGSSVTATQIAQKFVSLKPDVLIAISTPSAQLMLAARGQTAIPLVFSAVTDPVTAHLVKSLERPGVGITGVSDHLSAETQLQFLKDRVPGLKRLGVIYNFGESNSVSMVEELKIQAKSLNISLVTASANRTSEVASAAQSLAGRVEAIYIPNDNTVIAALESVVHVGMDRHIPIFAGDLGSAQRGVAGVIGFNRRKLGKEAGIRVAQYLLEKSKKVGILPEIAIKSETLVETIMNPEAAKKMGLEVAL